MLSVGLVLALVPDFASVTQGLVPVWLERIILFFAWIWFTNLFNFMDGINGITGVEMAGIGLGAVLVAGWHNAEILDAPANFPQYGRHYAAYWLDPHGFKLEVVSFQAEEG